MISHYTNITLHTSRHDEAIAYLKENGDSSYVGPEEIGFNFVIFHEDLSSQEDLAVRLSRKLKCAALLVMGMGSTLLYQLYDCGVHADEYVSWPHPELENPPDPRPQGDADVLAAAFEVLGGERLARPILRKEGKPGQPFANAINRHGELTRALRLPRIAAGASFAAIELGELPSGRGFKPSSLLRTS